MSDNTAIESNENVEQEIHFIEDLQAASDFELKHTPNVSVSDTAAGKTVKASIGLQGISHPHTVEHYIQWIKVYVNGELVGSAEFSAEQTPEASFQIAPTTEQIIVRALCNLHGIWEARL